MLFAISQWLYSISYDALLTILCSSYVDYIMELLPHFKQPFLTLIKAS